MLQWGPRFWGHMSVETEVWHGLFSVTSALSNDKPTSPFFAPFSSTDVVILEDWGRFRVSFCVLYQQDISRQTAQSQWMSSSQRVLCNVRLSSLATLLPTRYVQKLQYTLWSINRSQDGEAQPSRTHRS